MAKAQIATARRQAPHGCSYPNVEAPAQAAHLWCSLCPRPAPRPLHIQAPNKLHIQTSSCLGNSIFRVGCLICVFCPLLFPSWTLNLSMISAGQRIASGMAGSVSRNRRKYKQHFTQHAGGWQDAQPAGVTAPSQAE